MNPTTHTAEKLRDEFEAWCTDNAKNLCLRHHSERPYHYADTLQAWSIWKAAHESFERSAADAVPAAWLVTRDRDPTFPRSYIRECDADEICSYVTLHPLAVKRPVYTRPAQPSQTRVVDGYVLVPREPTEAMVDAYVTAVNEYLGNLSTEQWKVERANHSASVSRVARLGITAMIAAVPSPAKDA